MNFLVVAMTCFLMAFIVNTSSYASCTRHIYNNSGAPWTFEFTLSEGGFISFPTYSDCNNNGPCTVPAGQTYEINYSTNEFGLISGTVKITDITGETHSFNFDSDPTCPRIEHSGGTGAVAVNDPANGDLHVWANTWGNGKTIKKP